MKNCILLLLLSAFFSQSANATCACSVSPSGDTTGATDAAAIRTCVNGFGATGGQVSLGSGTFYVDSSIPLRSELLIDGAGSTATILKWVTNVSTKSEMFVWDGASSSTSLEDVTIRNLQIDGQNNWIIGIKVDGGGGSGRPARVTVRSAEIVNCGEYGIHIKQTDGVFIRDVTLSHNGYNAYEDATPYAAGNIYALNHNIYLRDTTLDFIEYVDSEDAAGDGINGVRIKSDDDSIQ